MCDFWSRLCAWLLPGVVLALVVGGIIALSISVVRGDDRMPGEWLDDNQEYGEAIHLVLVCDTSGPRDDFYSLGTANDDLLAFTRSRWTGIDLDNLLTRCLEFLRDGDIDQNRVSIEYSVYRPRTLKGDARDAVEDAQNELVRIEKETQLRRDIEKALAALRGEK